MQRNTARFMGYLVAFAAVVSLIVGNRQLWGIVNTDAFVDVERVIFAVWLLWAAYRGADTAVRSALLTFGVFSMVLAVIGFIDGTIGGLIPHGLTTFDCVARLIGGAALTAAAWRPVVTTRYATRDEVATAFRERIDR